MKMEFIFDKNKLKKEGYDEEQCLNAIRKHFKGYNSKTIKEWYWYIDEGDGLGEQKEDCLQSYYEVKAMNT